MPPGVTFDEFRQWALDQSRSATRRWEDPYDDEAQVLLGLDAHGAFHIVPVPPIYLKNDRGHVHWRGGALPDLVANRSLRRIAFRSSAWASANPKYEDRPVDDPKRTERLLLQVAEKGRFEIWYAPITRSRSGLPAVGDWELYARDREVKGGAVPTHIRRALDRPSKAQAPTMPAADMVLGPFDVPGDLFPLQSSCGPLPSLDESTTSSYRAFFRPEAAGPAILSTAIVAAVEEATSEFIEGAVRALGQLRHEEFEGPPLGNETHYFRGTIDDGRLTRYVALWRYPNVFCQVDLASPASRFKASDVRRYAAVQDKRARAVMEERRVGAR
jgi:hypothetical protein